MQTAKDVFGGIGQAKVSIDRDPYVTPGEYLCQINEVQLIDSKENPGVIFYRVQFQVLEASEGGNAVGTKMGWIQKMTGVKVALGTVAKFLYAASGLDSQNADIRAKYESKMEDLSAASVSDKQPFTGKKIRVMAKTIQTKEGKPFTALSFAPVRVLS